MICVVCALNYDVIGISKVVFDRVRGFDELVSGSIVCARFAIGKMLSIHIANFYVLICTRHSARDKANDS